MPSAVHQTLVTLTGWVARSDSDLASFVNREVDGMAHESTEVEFLNLLEENYTST